MLLFERESEQLQDRDFTLSWAKEEGTRRGATINKPEIEADSGNEEASKAEESVVVLFLRVDSTICRAFTYNFRPEANISMNTAVFIMVLLRTENEKEDVRMENLKDFIRKGIRQAR